MPLKLLSSEFELCVSALLPPSRLSRVQDSNRLALILRKTPMGGFEKGGWEGVRAEKVFGGLEWVSRADKWSYEEVNGHEFIRQQNFTYILEFVTLDNRKK